MRTSLCGLIGFSLLLSNYLGVELPGHGANEQEAASRFPGGCATVHTGVPAAARPDRQLVRSIFPSRAALLGWEYLTVIWTCIPSGPMIPSTCYVLIYHQIISFCTVICSVFYPFFLVRPSSGFGRVLYSGYKSSVRHTQCKHFLLVCGLPLFLCLVRALMKSNINFFHLIHDFWVLRTLYQYQAPGSFSLYTYTFAPIWNLVQCEVNTCICKYRCPVVSVTPLEKTLIELSHHLWWKSMG